MRRTTLDKLADVVASRSATARSSTRFTALTKAGARTSWLGLACFTRLAGGGWLGILSMLVACSTSEPAPADTTSSTSAGGASITGSVASSTNSASTNTGVSSGGASTSSISSGGSMSSSTTVTSNTSIGGATSTGGSASTSASTGGNGGGGSGPVSYALPPPSQCHNKNFIDFEEGCMAGDASSTCQGKCTTINACQESSADKPGADVTFICPRFMLFSDEMQAAALDDDNGEFGYAVVGHDVDQGGIDGNVQSTCCQCYQLVFAYPSPQNERQAQLNPDNPNPPQSGIPIPKPLIVQSFNTAATPHSFDIYMAAGGFGANNACAPGQQPQARSGEYLYTGYPSDGQPSQGGVKPVSLYSECKTEYQWVTSETLSSQACQERVAAACNQLESSIAGLTEQARRSCIEANSVESPYHLNWSVYAMKVECPEHLTQVTGCRLAPQGLPEVDSSVLTADQALQNPNFHTTSSLGTPYETTTMEDCCRPSCASTDWISGRGLVSDGTYNAFYSCDASGTPYTE